MSWPASGTFCQAREPSAVPTLIGAASSGQALRKDDHSCSAFSPLQRRAMMPVRRSVPTYWAARNLAPPTSAASHPDATARTPSEYPCFAR